jgi:hypothetical protein
MRQPLVINLGRVALTVEIGTRPYGQPYLLRLRALDDGHPKVVIDADCEPGELAAIGAEIAAGVNKPRPSPPVKPTVKTKRGVK